MNVNIKILILSFIEYQQKKGGKNNGKFQLQGFNGVHTAVAVSESAREEACMFLLQVRNKNRG